MNLTKIIFVCIFPLSFIYSQDYTWEYINPWRFQDVKQVTLQNGGLYFVEEQYNEGDYIMYLRPDYSGFDTIYQTQGFSMADYAIYDDETIYASTLLTGSNWGLLKVNPITNDIELIYEAENFIEIQILNASIFIKETPYFGNEIKVSKLNSLDIPELLFAYDEIGNNGSQLEVEENFVLFYNDNTCFFSKDEGVTWDTIINQSKFDDVEIINEHIAIVDGQHVYTYNENGDQVNYFKYVNDEHPWFIGNIKNIKNIGDRLYLSNEFFLQYSDDNGQTWIDLSDEIDKFNRGGSIFPYNNKLFIKSTKGLEYYDLETEEFHNFNSNGMNRIRSMYAINDSSYIVHQHGNSHVSSLYRSFDNGITWTQQLLDFNPLFTNTDNKLHVVSKDTFYISSKNQKRVWRTTNAGYTWSVFLVNMDMECFVMSILTNEKFYCFDRDNDELLYSSDSGIGWSTIEITDPPLGLVFPRFIKGKNAYDWMIDATSDSVYIFKLNNELIVQSYIFENKISGSSRSAYTNDKGLIFSSDEVLLLHDFSDSITIYANLEDSPVIFNENEKFLLGIEDFDLYIYYKNDDNFIAEKQFIYGEPVSFYFNGQTSFINSSDEILLTGHHSNLVKYGPPIDKGIFVGPVETAYDFEGGLSVYPNPFSDNIIVDSDKHYLHELYTINGQLILTAETNTISTNNVGAGMYILVSYEGNQRVSVRKMVK